MSISDILAIQKLMPGDPPEIEFFRPGDEPARKPYKFRDDADRAAAIAEAQALSERLAEKHDWDEESSAEELNQIITASPRLQSAVFASILDHMIATEPVLKRHFAKQARAERARLKRATAKLA